jgi:DNA polymerase (family 10)
VDKPLAELSPEEIQALPGVGDAIAAKISHLLLTGKLDLLEKYLEKTPPGVVQMLSLKGIGPKKIAQLWHELGVESIGELYYACLENRLITLKGFGEKTQENLLQHIEFLLSNERKQLYARVEKHYLQKIGGWQSLLGTENIQATGAFRDKEPILETLELIAVDLSLKDIQVAFEKTGLLTAPLENGELLIKDPDGIDLIFYESKSSELGSVLFEKSGETAFRNWVKEKAGASISTSFDNEAKIFENAGLPFIAPECRVDALVHYVNTANLLESVIQLNDIKGVVHTHSKYSDGANTVEQLARHCKELGYEYLVMSDHSKSAFYAKGLEVSRVMQQQEEIDLLNQQLAPFKIFKSIESDILNDGALDYEDNILATFDLVIASVHSNLRMDENKAMHRLITAIENPFTTILGHMTGRLLLSRAGYPLDHKKIIDACAANGVFIELNANPHRLDIDYKWLEYCMDKNVMVSINPDAHNLQGVGDIKYGVLAARKGLLQKNFCLNALNAEEFAKKIKSRLS